MINQTIELVVPKGKFRGHFGLNVDIFAPAVWYSIKLSEIGQGASNEEYTFSLFEPIDPFAFVVLLSVFMFHPLVV